MKLKKYIEQSNKLIEMPYNELNLNKFYGKVFPLHPFCHIFTDVQNVRDDDVINLMSGQDTCGDSGILTVRSGEEAHPKIYLIGKGVLFDSGGYSLKSSSDMQGMHTDMAGMAIASKVAEYCIEELGLYCVEGYSPVTTNFLHTSLINIGDKIKIGEKTVEITNTDAEGRLILASALSHLNEVIKPKDIVITIATLTGACAYAVGEKATVYMSPNKMLAFKYHQSALKVKELAWELPLWKYLQKDFAKKVIPNTGKRKCGTIWAGMFLKQFVKYPKNWIHLDIAESAYDEKKKKATGQPIRTLVKFIKELI